MIRKGSECNIEYREHMRDGDGTVQLTHFITGPDELCGKGRLFSKITLNPGCGIGYHIHEHETEFYYILKGEAVFNDNGTEVLFHAGDVGVTGNGAGHGIENRSNEPVEMIALIVLE